MEFQASAAFGGFGGFGFVFSIAIAPEALMGAMVKPMGSREAEALMEALMCLFSDSALASSPCSHVFVTALLGFCCAGGALDIRPP